MKDFKQKNGRIDFEMLKRWHFQRYRRGLAGERLSVEMPVKRPCEGTNEG